MLCYRMLNWLNGDVNDLEGFEQLGGQSCVDDDGSAQRVLLWTTWVEARAVAAESKGE